MPAILLLNLCIENAYSSKQGAKNMRRVRHYKSMLAVCFEYYSDKTIHFWGKEFYWEFNTVLLLLSIRRRRSMPNKCFKKQHQIREKEVERGKAPSLICLAGHLIHGLLLSLNSSKSFSQSFLVRSFSLAIAFFFLL